MVRIRSGDYNKCAAQSIKEVIVQIDIEHLVSVRAIREFLSKEMSEKKYVDRHLINNIRIRARKKKLAL